MFVRGKMRAAGPLPDYPNAAIEVRMAQMSEGRVDRFGNHDPELFA